MGHGRGREKTKPIWRSDEAGRGGGQDTGRSRPGRPWYWDPKRDESRLGTHSWALAPMLEHLAASLRTGLLRQTNPILARAISRTSAVPTRSCDELHAGRVSVEQSQFPVDGNGSGPTRGPCRRRGRLYKQTQFAKGRHDRAKQSQFCAGGAGIPHHSSILSFHHSREAADAPGSRGSLYKSKPILPAKPGRQDARGGENRKNRGEWT
jgi:hypothetical protein